MQPYSNNSHLIADLAREHYNDLRREADARRLQYVALSAAEARCVSTSSRLAWAVAMLRLRLAGTPRTEIVYCP